MKFAPLLIAPRHRAHSPAEEEPRTLPVEEWLELDRREGVAFQVIANSRLYSAPENPTLRLEPSHPGRACRVPRAALTGILLGYCSHSRPAPRAPIVANVV